LRVALVAACGLAACATSSAPPAPSAPAPSTSAAIPTATAAPPSTPGPAPLRPSAGETLGALKQSAFFGLFRFEEDGRHNAGGGYTTVTFALPRASKLQALVRLHVTIDDRDRIFDMELTLAHVVVDGGKEVFARDLAKSFIAASTPSGGLPAVRDLMNEIETREVPNQVGRATPAPSVSAAPSKGFLTFVGKERIFDQTLSGSMLRLVNDVPQGAPQLVIGSYSNDLWK
jgi:hypothetical protein